LASDKSMARMDVVLEDLLTSPKGCSKISREANDFVRSFLFVAVIPIVLSSVSLST